MDKYDPELLKYMTPEERRAYNEQLYPPELLAHMTPEERRVYDEQQGVTPAPKSTAEDISHGLIPWAAQSATGLRSTFGNLGDLALKGVQKLGEATGSENLAGAAKFMQEQNRPYTSPARMEKLQEKFPGADLGYQPTSVGGEVAQAAENIIPSAAAATVTGAGSLIPNMVRALTAAGGSVAGRHAGESLLPSYMQSWGPQVAEMLGGAFGWGLPNMARKAIAPSSVSPLHEQQVANVRAAGVPVGVEQATQSPWLRSITGGPPARQAEALQEAMFRQGGLTVPPGVHPQDAAAQLANRLALQRMNLAPRFPSQAQHQAEADANALQAATGHAATTGAQHIVPEDVLRGYSPTMTTPLKGFARDAIPVTRDVPAMTGGGWLIPGAAGLAQLAGAYAGHHLGWFGPESAIALELAGATGLGGATTGAIRGAQRPIVRALSPWLENTTPRLTPGLEMDPETASWVAGLEGAKRLPAPTNEPTE
jgi:hypothetical protein